MKWFYDMKTMTKLLMSFAMTTTLMVVVGYMGISGMSEINGMLNTLYERDMVGLKQLQRANAEAINGGRWVRQTIIDTDEATMMEDVRKFDQTEKDFHEAIEAASKTLIMPEGKAKLQDVRSSYAQFLVKAREVIKLTLANDNKRANEVLTKEMRPLGVKLETDLNDIVAMKERLGKQAYDDSDVVYFRDRKVSIGAIAAAALLGFTMAMVVGRAVGRPLASAAQVLEKVAAGDFTERLEIDTKDEVGELAKSLNTAVDRMRKALDEVRSVASEVASASSQLASSSTDIASGAQKQAASLEETAASLEEITSTVRQNADNAQHASQLASSSRDVAEKGGRVVDAAVTAMGEITTASKKIAEIITAIDEIAFQTNLLALNAAVEAARAGEQGRGFAVVAAEVRNLAQRSATAAKEIKGLIVDSVGKIEVGSKHVNDSGSMLQEIVASVKRVTDMVSEIAAASREQNTGIEQVNKAVAQMDQVTQQNASQTEELSATAESLTQQAGSLQALVARFQLENEDDAPHRAAPAKAAPAPARSGRRLVAAPSRSVVAFPPPLPARARKAAPEAEAPLAATGTDGFDEF